MIINISKVLKLSLIFAVCAGQGVYADQTRAMAFAKNFVMVLPADQVAIMAAGLYGAIGGLYEARKDDWRNKVGCVGIGALTTLGASILLNPQQPQTPATLFGSVGGALNFLGAQNYKQCFWYGAVAAGCGFANPVLREMISQHPKLAAGFAGAAALGKIAHLKIKSSLVARRGADRLEIAFSFFEEVRRAEAAKVAKERAEAAKVRAEEREARERAEEREARERAAARERDDILQNVASLFEAE